MSETCINHSDSLVKGVLTASSPGVQKKTILRHQNSVKNDKIKRVSLEVVNEKPSHKSMSELLSYSNQNSRKLKNFFSTGRNSSMLNRPIFHMGSSFEDKSDEESLFESNGSAVTINNNSKGVKDENIALLTRK